MAYFCEADEPNKLYRHVILMYYSSQNTTASLLTFGNETNCTVQDHMAKEEIFSNPNSLSVFVRQKNYTELQNVLTNLVDAASSKVALTGTDKSKVAFLWQDITGLHGSSVQDLTVIVQALADNISKNGFQMKINVQSEVAELFKLINIPQPK